MTYGQTGYAKNGLPVLLMEDVFHNIPMVQMTTNNLTERMNKIIDNSIKNVVDFVERLYEVRDTLIQTESGQSLFNSGLVTYRNMRTVLHESTS